MKSISVDTKYCNAVVSFDFRLRKHYMNEKYIFDKK